MPRLFVQNVRWPRNRTALNVSHALQVKARTGNDWQAPEEYLLGGTVVNVQCLSRVAVMLTSTHVVDTVHSAVLHLIME